MEFQVIDPKMSMSDLIVRWPQSIPILIHHHMDCVGCHMAVFDSLEYAAETYRIVTDELIQEILKASKPE